MSKQNIGVSTDCACDLPDAMLDALDIGVIRFYVRTETGLFLDGDEITAQNVAEYYRSGRGALVTDEARPDEYAEFFRKRLKQYDELIHITISSGSSYAYERACAAVVQLGMLADKVKIVDLRTLSTGMAHLLIKAAEMRDSGCGTEEMIAALEDMREHLHVSFITQTPKQMFRNGYMGKFFQSVCESLHMHPIFRMKNGKTGFGGIGFGDMRGAIRRYIRNVLISQSYIDTGRLFITHVGLSLDDIAMIKNEVAKRADFDEIIVTEASAVIAGTCGDHSMGLIFMKKY